MKKAALIIEYGSTKYCSFLFNDGTCYRVNMRSKLSMFLFRVKSGFSVNSICNDLSIKILTIGNNASHSKTKNSKAKRNLQADDDRIKHAECGPNFDIEPPKPKYVTGV